MTIQIEKGADKYMSTPKKTYKKYSPELKLEAVKRAMSGESVLIIAAEYDMPDPDYIYVWIDKYKVYGEVGLNRKRRKQPQMDKDQLIQELEMENEILKKYLQILNEEEKSTSSK